MLIPTVAILLVAGSPFLDLQLANSDVNQLPTTAEARQGADLLQAQFPQVGHEHDRGGRRFRPRARRPVPPMSRPRIS